MERDQRLTDKQIDYLEAVYGPSFFSKEDKRYLECLERELEEQGAGYDGDKEGFIKTLRERKQVALQMVEDDEVIINRRDEFFDEMQYLTATMDHRLADADEESRPEIEAEYRQKMDEEQAKFDEDVIAYLINRTRDEEELANDEEEA